MTELGPHLLGRIPSPPDERDYRLENFLGATTDTVVIDPAKAAAQLRLTQITYRQWAATTYKDVTLTHWWQAFNLLGQIAPPPAPVGDVVWADPEPVLDQGAYGTCVGNGFAQWGNTLPVDDHYNETDARAIYYEATILDGSPDDPDSRLLTWACDFRAGVGTIRFRALSNGWHTRVSVVCMDPATKPATSCHT